MAGVGFGEPRMIKILAFGLAALTAAASAQAAELTELAQASAPTDVVPQEAPDAFNETQPPGENSPDASQARAGFEKEMGVRDDWLRLARWRVGRDRCDWPRPACGPRPAVRQSPQGVQVRLYERRRGSPRSVQPVR